MLFPFRHSAIFRSRWIALLWAAGICLTAAEFAGTADDRGVKNDAGTQTTPPTQDAIATLIDDANRAGSTQPPH